MPADSHTARSPRRSRRPALSTVLTSCAAAAAAVVTLSGCDSAPPVQANARQVTVVGSGEVQGAPDTMTADVGIEVVAPDVTAAMGQANERQQAMLTAVKGRGVEAGDIRTQTVNVQPQYGANSEITGYRATNSVEVTIRQLDAAPGILTAVVDAGGNSARINGIRYSIEDDSKLIGDARARAFEDARSRAAQYAELSGLTLGQVISISEAPETIVTRPVPVPQDARAADIPLEPGQQTVSFTVTAVWELN